MYHYIPHPDPAITEALSRGLAEGAFHLSFQPQYDYITGRLAGAEVLVRWDHPTLGLLSPADFIPHLERSGQVCTLDQYVWDQACRCMRRWTEGGVVPVPLSVNVSRVDVLDDGLCGRLTALVSRHGLTPEMLRLEITESAYIEDPAQLTAAARQLRQAGFTLEMDDFGSGFSSLHMLQDVPVDILKLDRGFLRDLESSPRCSAILSAVIRMAHSLDLPVIAEGVDTQAQADKLRALGCRMMQGYFFAPPMDEAAFLALLRAAAIQAPLGIPQVPAVHPFETHGAALMTLFDEVTELDYGADAMILLHSRYSPDRVDIPLRGLAAATERYTSKWLVGSPDRQAYLDFISPDHIAAVHAAGRPASMELQVSDGRWYRSLLFPLGPARALFCTLSVTAEKLAERQRMEKSTRNLLHWKETLYHILAEMPGMLVFDYDPQTDRMTTCLNTRDGQPEPPTEQFLTNLEDHRHLAPESVPAIHAGIRQALAHPSSGTFDYQARYFTPDFRWYRAHYASLVDDSGAVYRIVGRIEDIEEEHVLRKLAHHDTMTGFLNHDAASRAIDASMAAHGGGTLLVVDLDDFKQVNDVLGHLYGDEFLKRTADTIRGLFRKEDILGRFGGDEFLVFLPGVHSAPLAENRAQDVVRAIRQLQVPELGQIRCSVGIAITKDGRLGMDALFHQADQALYEAKRDGKGHFVLYRA